MVRSHSFAWILVSVLSLALSAPLQAGITPSGDVDPINHSWWTGGGSSLTDAYIGKTAAGSVIVDLGSDLSSSYGYIGYTEATNSKVTIDGYGSTWANSGGLFVGYDGQGTLNITNGGAVSNTYGYIGCWFNVTGVVTVDGNGSIWANSGSLCVGYDGQGTLNITNGGIVSNTCGYIGIEHGTGEVTVDGNGSTWTNSGDLIVGCEGQGTLNITNGGVVSNTTGYIDSIGEVTVDGNGSTWANTYGLFVGLHGQGTLNITNGGAVSNSYGYISSWSDSIGEVTVDGSGSTWANSGNLSVGHYEGQGTLNITNGGAVSNSYGYIGFWSDCIGEVTVDGNGSTWTNSGSLFVGHHEGQGTLNITDGGTVTVGGNLSINSQSTLNILLASPGDPLLNVAGDATLNGMLNVDLASGFALNQGDLFILIDLTDISNTITGTFTGLAEGDSVGNFDGLDLLISYAGGDGNDVTLSAIPEPATLSLLVMGGLALIRRRQK